MFRLWAFRYLHFTSIFFNSVNKEDNHTFIRLFYVCGYYY